MARIIARFSSPAPFPAPEVIFRASPLFWLGIFALAMPWARFAHGAWTLYPGHLAVGLLAGAVLLTETGWRAAAGALLPLLALGGYLAGVAALRGNWESALFTLGGTAIQFLWGAGAYRLGLRERTPTAIPRSLLLLLGAVLAAGLSAWALQHLWPAGCGALNCQVPAPRSPPFAGGWHSSGQFAVFLLFVLPVVATPAIGSFGLLAGGRPTPSNLFPALLAGGAGLGLIAGGGAGSLALVVLGLALFRFSGGESQGEGERLALRGAVFFLAFAMVLVYGLVPGYFSRLVSGVVTPASLRLTLGENAPRMLSSDRIVPYPLLLGNTGWSEVGGEGSARARVGARLLITPERGLSRAHDLPSIPIPKLVAPGESLALEFPLRLPPWVKEGYLSWRLEDAQGRPLPLAEGSQPGFRFRNGDFQRISSDPENRLSAWAARARAFRDRTRLPDASHPDPDSVVIVLGGLLDTLFFSPLWGESGKRANGGKGGNGGNGDPPSRQIVPFSPSRPFFPAVFQQYGLAGLLLAAWIGWRLLTRSLRISGRLGPSGGLAWRLAPISIVLLGVTGLYSPVLGSYHAVWAFFLLAGWMEGRYARLFPAPVSGGGSERGYKLRFPLPWRMRALRKGYTGSVRTR